MISIPANFTADLVTGRRPQLLIEADASDPAVSSNAIGKANEIVASALRQDLKGPLARLQRALIQFMLDTHTA